MINKTIKPIATAVGASFLAMAMVPTVSADANPFAINELSAAYELSSADKKGAEGKCGEGKCGGSKAESEGSCGGNKAESEGKCGGSKAESQGSNDKGEKAEGKCGEGKCGGNA